MANLPIPGHGKFYDLNLTIDNNVKNAAKKLKDLIELGYEAVALNNFVASGSQEKGSKKKKVVIPRAPEKLALDNESRTYMKINQKEMHQFKRITIELNDLDDLHKVREAHLSSFYDIIAVLPKTERLFHNACTELHIDIICIDGSEKLPFMFKHTTVNCAISRGIHFEVCYSPMLRDLNVFRTTVTTMQKLVEISKGKNLILSSNAAVPLELRGPYDVANMNTLFGLKENIFPHTVSKNCRNAIVHGFTRKTAKCAIYVEKIPSPQAEDSSTDIETIDHDLLQEMELFNKKRVAPDHDPIFNTNPSKKAKN